MRFTFAFVLAAVSVNSVFADADTADASALSFVNNTLSTTLGGLLTPGNHYGAPIPPWETGCKPGWYYGQNPGEVIGWVIPWLVDELICAILGLIPGCLHCPSPHPPPPPPKNPWTPTFSNLTGATQASDYLTYGLVDTIADCETMCLGVQGCTFINTYHDVNGKNGSPLLTCSLFSSCHDASDADNFGGQTQPDGSVDYITDSDGFCYSSS